MISYYTKSLEHTIGIIITLRFPYTIDLHKNGYLHAGEHFMFSGTESMDRETLRKKHFYLFNELEAQTSREWVRIFCFVDRNDLKETVGILHDMIYKWRCRISVFEDEKEQLIEESKKYFSSYSYQLNHHMRKAIGLEYFEPLGTRSSAKALTVKDIAKIKAQWKSMLDMSMTDILVISGKLTTKEKHIFATLDHGKTIISNSIINTNTINNIVQDKTIVALVQTRNMVSYDLLWDRILYWRWYNNKNLRFDHKLYSLNHTTVFYTHRTAGIDHVEARTFLLTPPTKTEFSFAKESFLRHFRACLDGIDIIESLTWLSDFNDNKYTDLPTNDYEAIYKHFERLSFNDFQKFHKSILRNTTNK